MCFQSALKAHQGRFPIGLSGQSTDGCIARQCRCNVFRYDTTRSSSLYRFGGTFGIIGSSALAASAEWMKDQLQHFEGQDFFERIVARAATEKWSALPIGELMGKIAMELKGTPYVGFTLETSQGSGELCGELERPGLRHVF